MGVVADGATSVDVRREDFVCVDADGAASVDGSREDFLGVVADGAASVDGSREGGVPTLLVPEGGTCARLVSPKLYVPVHTFVPECGT